ncbi:hypothetical protein FIBSPDRAFT_743989 [Athelia psychrophila]|uniref:BTB domain-containing protein n=1 Tax=Athelia psychrophila TaxID=1759441 RepID=A0A166HYD0_9AGAM|nr:hypothetical protein FIBSPDRAFT_743989 [Fibularhizoctonia sp. CBS 109695]
MFNDSNADLIIRTSDNVCFRVHRLILSLSVPVFATMFTLPQISNPLDQPDPTDPITVTALVAPSIVDVSEGSRTMQLFLQLCYPATDPNIKTLAELQGMLEVATKYETDGIKNRIAKLLEKFLKQSSAVHNSIDVYAIAHRYRLERDVRLAAKQFLQRPLSAISWYQQLDCIPASAYYRLQDYYLRCRTAASKRFLTGHLSWATASETKGAHGSPFVWFNCRKCAGSPAIKISNNEEVQPTEWWSDYMQSVSVTLSDVPCFSTEAMTSAKDRALEAAVECSKCRAKVIPQMTAFQSLISAEIESAIESVSFLKSPSQDFVKCARTDVIL